MLAKRTIFSSAILFALIVTITVVAADSGTVFTLQVASFPDATQAADFARSLTRAGEPAGFGLIELPGKGRWTRVYVGSFNGFSEARQHGELLVKRGLITEYLVRTTREVRELERPRSVTRRLTAALISRPATLTVAAPAEIARRTGYDASRESGAWALASSRKSTGSLRPTGPRLASLPLPAAFPSPLLPAVSRVRLEFAPAFDTGSVPQPDPAVVALDFINQNSDSATSEDVGNSSRRRGGLWISGDCGEALDRLGWIAGQDAAGLIIVDAGGRVRIERGKLLTLAGAQRLPQAEAAVRVARFITANEGLLLLAQISEGQYRYLLHVGSQPQTLGGVVEVGGSANLDNNYDSRINPYRRNGKKLDIERPPSGFDALVALNPAARWYNLRTGAFVPVGNITFHELAEAHAKLAYHLDYLESGRNAGAHEIALEREERLKDQRPAANVVLTLGSNRLFKSEEEMRQFHPAGGALGRQ